MRRLTPRLPVRLSWRERKGGVMVFLQLANVLVKLLDFYEWLIVIWCLMSWFPIREGSLIGDIAVVINRLVAPYISLFRRFIPPLGGIDFSPIVAIVALSLVQNLIWRVGVGLVF